MTKYITKHDIVLTLNNLNNINACIDFCKNKLNLVNIVTNDYLYYLSLLNNIFSSAEYKNFIQSFTTQLNNFKNILRELKGNLICNNCKVNINDIQSIWIRDDLLKNYQTFSNRTQYFLKINNLLFDSSQFYFFGKKKDTNIINMLGFLNKFQYIILHTNDNNSYLNSLKLNYYSDPFTLSQQNLKELILYTLENMNMETDMQLIKRYWLCSKMTSKDLYQINNIQAKFILKEL